MFRLQPTRTIENIQQNPIASRRHTIHGHHTLITSVRFSTSFCSLFVSYSARVAFFSMVNASVNAGNVVAPYPDAPQYQYQEHAS